MTGKLRRKMQVVMKIALLQLLTVCLSTVNAKGVSVPELHVEQTLPRDHLAIPLLPHHAVAARRRKLQDSELPDDLHIDPLYQGLGTHYVDLWVGCPPQRQTVIVDTGSSATAFPCSSCEDCGASERHTDGLYKEEESTCFRSVSCQDGCQVGDCKEENDVCLVARYYEEGSSWMAYEAIDKAYSGGSHDTSDEVEETQLAFDLHFGCQTSVTGLFKDQLADGILGMKDSDKSYWKQMFTAGRIQSQVFSLCFTKAPTASSEGSGAGAMIMGGSDSRLHLTNMVYAEQIQDDNGFFSIQVEKVFLKTAGGENMDTSGGSNEQWKTLDISADDLNKGKVIIDSGTTGTFLTEKLATPFASEWKGITGREFENTRIQLSEEQLLALPTIVFQMKSPESEAEPALIAFPPSHYMHYRKSEDTYEPSILFNAEEGKTQTLGANFLSGKDVLFDMDNRRIGFAESNCDYWSMGNLNFDHTASTTDNDILQPPIESPDVELTDPESVQSVETPETVGTEQDEIADPEDETLEQEPVIVETEEDEITESEEEDVQSPEEILEPPTEMTETVVNQGDEITDSEDGTTPIAPETVATEKVDDEEIELPEGESPSLDEDFTLEDEQRVGSCGSVMCQTSLLIVFIASVSVVAAMAIRRSVGNTVAYDPAGIEMQSSFDKDFEPYSDMDEPSSYYHTR